MTGAEEEEDSRRSFYRRKKTISKQLLTEPGEVLADFSSE